VKHVFVDTGGWYALVDKTDPDHHAAREFLIQNNLPLITTNFVFDETVTLIRQRMGWAVAGAFGTKLKASSFTGLVAVSESDEAQAWQTFLKYEDQDFSYTDCTSFAVMLRLGVTTAFSFDAHFLTMKYQVVPGM